MSYYQGDYYEGDYYQGDPFLGSLIGMGVTWLGKKLLRRGATKTAIALAGSGAMVGGGTGLAVGGVAGPIVAAGARGLWSRLTTPAPPPMAYNTLRGPTGQGVDLTVRGQTGMQGACGCPSGYHPNKTTTRLGHPPGTTCVRNRSMNVANPRALRRSLRRVAGFGKLANRAKKTINATARAMK